MYPGVGTFVLIRPTQTFYERINHAYISKPIKPQELYQVIESAVLNVVEAEPGTLAEARLKPAFDREAALARVDGDLELFKEVVALFVVDAPRLLSQIRASIQRRDGEGLERAAHQLLSQIRASIQRRDGEGLERAAHQLKSTVGNFDADDAFEAALRLEAMGSASDFTVAEEACSDLEKRAAQLENALVALSQEVEK